MICPKVNVLNTRCCITIRKKKCCFSSCATLVYTSASILSSAIQQFMAGIKVKETDTDSNFTERTISKGVVSL